MGVGRVLSWGGTSAFYKRFSRVGQSGEICFLPLKTKKTALFAEIFKFLPPFDIHACV